MWYEIPGTLIETGRRVKAKLEAPSLQEAIRRVQLRGVRIDPEFFKAHFTQGFSPQNANNGTTGESQSSQESARRTPQHANSRYTTLTPHDFLILCARWFIKSKQAILQFGFLGIVTVLIVGMGALHFLLSQSSISRPAMTLAPPTQSPHSGFSPKPPEKSAEELRRIRVAAATLASWNETCRIERTYIAKCHQYNDYCAREIIAHYSTANLADVDSDLSEWITDVIQAAQKVLDVTNQQVAALDSLESHRDAKALEAGVDFAAKAGAEGESSVDQLARGLAGGILGAVTSNIVTEVQKNKVLDNYKKLISEAQVRLKRTHEQRAGLLTRLSHRYDWRPQE